MFMFLALCNVWFLLSGIFFSFFLKVNFSCLHFGNILYYCSPGKEQKSPVKLILYYGVQIKVQL